MLDTVKPYRIVSEQWYWKRIKFSFELDYMF